MHSDALAPGLADPVLDAQAVFRSVMEVLARPGTIQRLPTRLSPPAPLPPGLAAIALTLADADAPLFLDAPLAAAPAVADWMRFHTGAAIVSDPKAAAFALIADAPGCRPFADFALGEPAYPDRSTTLVLAVSRLETGSGFVLEGPGIAGRARLDAGLLPADFRARRAENHALFPCGVDLLLVSADAVAGLPRTTRIVE